MIQFTGNLGLDRKTKLRMGKLLLINCEKSLKKDTENTSYTEII